MRGTEDAFYITLTKNSGLHATASAFAQPIQTAAMPYYRETEKIVVSIFMRIVDLLSIQPWSQPRSLLKQTYKHIFLTLGGAICNK